MARQIVPRNDAMMGFFQYMEEVSRWIFKYFYEARGLFPEIEKTGLPETNEKVKYR